MKIIFVLLFLLAALSGCESLTKSLLKDPEVSVLDVKVTDIDMSDISLAITMSVVNPNAVPINLDRVSYELNVAGETVADGDFDEGVKVPANGRNNVTVPMKFKFKSVGNILSGIINRSFVKEYELKGTAQFGFFSVPFLKKGEVNLNK